MAPRSAVFKGRAAWQRGCRVWSSEIGVPSFAVVSQNDVFLQSIILMASGNSRVGRELGVACGPGCWLRLSPASGSSPSRVAIPDANGRRGPPAKAAAPIWTGANRLVLPLLALHFLTGRQFVAHPLHDPLFFVGPALQHRPRRTDKRVRSSIQTEKRWKLHSIVSRRTTSKLSKRCSAPC